MTAAPRLMLCMSPGCRRAAAPDSCYCERCFHLRLDGVMPERARVSRMPLLLAVLLLAAVAWWGRDDLIAWASPILATATFIQTPAREGCRTPDPGEQLVIIIAERHGQLFAQCQYVMSRGAARSRWQGAVL